MNAEMVCGQDPANRMASHRFYSSPGVYRALAVMIIKSSNLLSPNKTSKILSGTLPVFDLKSKHFKCFPPVRHDQSF